MIRLHFTNGNRTKAQKLDFWIHYLIKLRFWYWVTVMLYHRSIGYQNDRCLNTKMAVFPNFQYVPFNTKQKWWPSTDWYRSFRSWFRLTVALARESACSTENDNDSYIRLTKRLTLISIYFCAKNYGPWFRLQIFLLVLGHFDDTLVKNLSFWLLLKTVISVIKFWVIWWKFKKRT